MNQSNDAKKAPKLILNIESLKRLSVRSGVRTAGCENGSIAHPPADTECGCCCGETGCDKQ